MLTGKELGRAIESAIYLKIAAGSARSKAEIAAHFGVKPPSIHDWIKKGSISKDKLPELWRYFSDVVGPEHWGLDKWPIPDAPAPPPPAGQPKTDYVRPAPPDTRLIPVISYIQAGHPLEVVDAYAQGNGFDEIAVDAVLADELGPHAFALVVEGDSMSPEFQPGDLVLIDPEAPVRPGDIVVAKLDADAAATLKKYRDRGKAADGTPIIELVPLNDDYPTLVMDSANPGRLIGPVIEHRRRRRRRE